MNTNTWLVKFYKMCAKQLTLQLSPWMTFLLKQQQNNEYEYMVGKIS